MNIYDMSSVAEWHGKDRWMTTSAVVLWFLTYWGCHSSFWGINWLSWISETTCSDSPSKPGFTTLCSYDIITFKESSVCNQNSHTCNYFIFSIPGTVVQTSFTGISLCMCRNLYSLTLELREVHRHKGHLFKNHVVTLRWKMYFLVNKTIQCNLEKRATLRLFFTLPTVFTPFQVSMSSNKCWSAAWWEITFSWPLLDCFYCTGLSTNCVPVEDTHWS